MCLEAIILNISVGYNDIEEWFHKLIYFNDSYFILQLLKEYLLGTHEGNFVE